MYMGRFDEAIKEIKRALELEPLSLVINRNVGQVCFYARQYDQAIEALKRTIEMNPNFAYTHSILGSVYSQKSMYEEALAEFRIEKDTEWLGITYVRMGKRDEAQDLLEDLLVRSKKVRISPYTIAVVYFALGEKDQGFEWLEKAYEKHHGGLLYLKIDPAFDSVRSDERFKALLKKMNLE
jgi:tetratricopeptide (TPR) repeat protein